MAEHRPVSLRQRHGFETEGQLQRLSAMIGRRVGRHVGPQPCRFGGQRRPARIVGHMQRPQPCFALGEPAVAVEPRDGDRRLRYETVAALGSAAGDGDILRAVSFQPVAPQVPWLYLQRRRRRTPLPLPIRGVRPVSPYGRLRYREADHGRKAAERYGAVIERIAVGGARGAGCGYEVWCEWGLCAARGTADTLRSVVFERVATQGPWLYVHRGWGRTPLPLPIRGVRPVSPYGRLRYREADHGRKAAERDGAVIDRIAVGAPLRGPVQDAVARHRAGDVPIGGIPREGQQQEEGRPEEDAARKHGQPLGTPF